MTTLCYICLVSLVYGYTLYMLGFFCIWLHYIYICLLYLIYGYTMFIYDLFLWYMATLYLYMFGFFGL